MRKEANDANAFKSLTVWHLRSNLSQEEQFLLIRSIIKSKRMNSRRSITLATVVTAGISFIGIAQAQIQNLEITENSSSSLTANLNGVDLTVQNTASDEWTITGFATPNATGSLLWQEPGETTFNDVVAIGSALIVDSDVGRPGALGLPNGTPDILHFTLNGSPLLVTFTDLGDSSSRVPDTATTFGLLGISLAVLGTLAKARPLIFRPFNG